jgi:NADH:ubiquinone oxidoreductase subunit D
MNEIFSSQIQEMVLGPIHPALREPFRVFLSLDGEMIASCRYELGYVHKNVEESMTRQGWAVALPYCSRLDPECAAFTELALCLSYERMMGLSVSPRAQSIRMLVCELSRISSHMGYLARFAKTLGAQTFVHYVLRDREKILDLFELISGARFSLGYFRFGGVSADITEGFLERVLDVCDLIRVRIKEYNDIFCFNGICFFYFLERLFLTDIFTIIFG